MALVSDDDTISKKFRKNKTRQNLKLFGICPIQTRLVVQDRGVVGGGWSVGGWGRGGAAEVMI